MWSSYFGRRPSPSTSDSIQMTPPSPSLRDSVVSHTQSTASRAASTRPILAGMNTFNENLEPPNAPFHSIPGSSTSLTPQGSSESGPISLSVNYLPAKFPSTLLAPANPRKRKTGKGTDPKVPKPGGGVEAFKSGEARMPGENDEDYDGVSGGWFGGDTAGQKKPRLHWNRFKKVLFFANFCLSVYSLVMLILCLLIWFDVFKHADIIRVANQPELSLSTLAACLGLITSLVGWSGILLNNRAFLAIYTFMLWVCFGFLVAPGYITYHRRTFNLEGKINSEWSRNLGTSGRLRIQNQLACCGYFNPFIEATVSQTCYARSVLPGCKKAFLDFERLVLSRWYTVAFALVPLHIFVMVAGLLCSNHVTYRFGKGMMPKAYRLSMNSMAVIMDNYANQLADQYGEDVASDMMARSRSNLQIDTLQTMPYTSGANTGALRGKYDGIYSRSPDPNALQSPF